MGICGLSSSTSARWLVIVDYGTASVPEDASAQECPRALKSSPAVTSHHLSGLGDGQQRQLRQLRHRSSAPRVPHWNCPVRPHVANVTKDVQTRTRCRVCYRLQRYLAIARFYINDDDLTVYETVIERFSVQDLKTEGPPMLLPSLAAIIKLVSNLFREYSERF